MESIRSEISFVYFSRCFYYFLISKSSSRRKLMVKQDPLQVAAQSQDNLAELLARTPEEQQHLGYFHTLREICQQPPTWTRTSELMVRSAPALHHELEGISSLALTGSGSSEYAGDCVRIALQK